MILLMLFLAGMIYPPVMGTAVDGHVGAAISDGGIKYFRPQVNSGATPSAFVSVYP